ncbi:MAG: hypothetical protein LUB59_00690 [Candidatus Gastranaerophilales bacterium]|nr:hypothetical protein [Candidatus Gastranaerophilales bacterium]
MGMAASQVRFLSLQSRNNSISRQLMTLSNRKMALSRDMSQVALNYTNALNQTVLYWSNDSGSTYNALTYDLLMTPNDLNTETPYIVTNAATGEVVLNSDELTDSDGNGLGFSYVDIAKMISSYSGVDDDGNLLYNNASTAIHTANVAAGTIVTGGDSAIAGAWDISNDNYDYSFDTSLRHEIFKMMGLITDEDDEKHLELLNKLYGSEDAYMTGVYPVGSAWGDYYLAVANLQAYEDYSSSYQLYSAANTFDNSLVKTETDTYSNSLYDYSYDIVSTDSNSSRASSNTVITQNAYSTSATSALSRIDFNSYSGTDSTSYTSSNGTTLTTTVSSNGVSYKYSVDDIWSNALEQYEAAGNTISDLTCVNALDSVVDCACAIGTGDGELVCVAASSNHNLDLSGVTSSLESYIDQFITVLSFNSIVELNSSILQSAKEQTAQLFYDNRNGGYDGASGLHSGSKKADKKARSRANGKNHIGYSRYGGVHSASRAYVDLGTLFNTFITYYSQLSAGQNPELLDSSSAPSMSYNDSSETTLSDLFMNDGTNWYVGEQTKDSNGTVMVSYSQLTTTAPSDVSDYTANGGVIYVLDTSSGTGVMRAYSGSADDTAGYTKYYVAGYDDDEDSTNDYSGDTLTYNTSGVTWDEDNDLSTTNQTIYGTVATADGDLYYFTDIAGLNTYLTTGSLSGATLYQARTLGSSSSADIVIADDESDSRYGISISGIPKDDEDIQSYLEQAVSDAYDYILELEDEIDNLYSSRNQKLMDYYDALFQRIAENGWVVDENTSSDKSTSTTYLNNKLQNNDYFITTCSAKSDEDGYNYTSKMATSITKIFSVHDENAESQALAEYEAEKSYISAKEEKIDVIMEKLETEYESNSTMMESIQNIVSENVEKTFKMFG